MTDNSVRKMIDPLFMNYFPINISAHQYKYISLTTQPKYYKKNFGLPSKCHTEQTHRSHFSLMHKKMTAK
jgi:hypothetical protein